MKSQETFVKIYDELSLSLLEPVLEQWVESVIQYSKIVSEGENACYWYNERANVGILAGSAWKKGWVALEEYGTEKYNPRGKSKDEKNKNANLTRSGRCDLFIANEQISFAVEAKVAWQNIVSGYGKSKNKFDEAWHDAGKLKNYEADNRLAACFVIPYLQAKNKVRHEFSEWRNKLSGEEESPEIKSPEIKSLDLGALAWVFPESCASLENDNGYIFPGVCLLLKVRKRGVKK